MPRWTMLVLFCVAVSACQETTPSAPEPGTVLDQLSTRQDAYNTQVGTLATAKAIQSETATYAADMHDLIDRLQKSSQRHAGINALVSGYTAEDMQQATVQMLESVDSYTVRMKQLQLVDDLRAIAAEHEAAMNELFQEMNGMLGGD